MKGKFALHKSTESSLCNSFRMPFRRFALGVMLVLIVVLYFDAAELRRRFLTDDQADVAWREDRGKGAVKSTNELLSLWEMYKSEKDMKKKVEWQELIRDTILHRKYLDVSIDSIVLFLFGPNKDSVLKFERGRGPPLIDDLNCLNSMVRLFEASCGSLTEYGLKHMRALANICNFGVSPLEMEEACKAACSGPMFAKWSPLTRGYTM